MKGVADIVKAEAGSQAEKEAYRRHREALLDLIEYLNQEQER
jgi:hypothetical protein